MSSSPNLSSLTRREALKTGLIFSSAFLTAGWQSRLNAAPPNVSFDKKGMHFLAVGDFGTGNEAQAKVAKQMNDFAGKLNAPLTAVLALGDNFYQKLEVERFQPHFEEMYSKEHLNVPFYATLGNHDYGPGYDSKQGPAKADIQLDYAKDNPQSRWKMPAKWYTVDFPSTGKPLVKIIYLDGNSFEGALTPQEKIDQKRFLEAELKKERVAKWVWVVTHYPMFSDTTKRGDGNTYIKNWGGYMQENPISLYLTGHDHNLQHLQMDGYSPSFLVSGGGGAKLYEVTGTGRGFSQQIMGFNHIHVDDERITVQIIDSDGNCLHSFTRDLAGKIEVASI